MQQNNIKSYKFITWLVIGLFLAIIIGIILLFTKNKSKIISQKNVFDINYHPVTYEMMSLETLNNKILAHIYNPALLNAKITKALFSPSPNQSVFLSYFGDFAISLAKANENELQIKTANLTINADPITVSLPADARGTEIIFGGEAVSWYKIDNKNQVTYSYKQLDNDQVIDFAKFSLPNNLTINDEINFLKIIPDPADQNSVFIGGFDNGQFVIEGINLKSQASAIIASSQGLITNIQMPISGDIISYSNPSQNILTLTSLNGTSQNISYVGVIVASNWINENQLLLETKNDNGNYTFSIYDWENNTLDKITNSDKPLSNIQADLNKGFILGINPHNQIQRIML